MNLCGEDEKIGARRNITPLMNVRTESNVDFVVILYATKALNKSMKDVLK